MRSVAVTAVLAISLGLVSGALADPASLVKPSDSAAAKRMALRIPDAGFYRSLRRDSLTINPEVINARLKSAPRAASSEGTNERTASTALRTIAKPQDLPLATANTATPSLSVDTGNAAAKQKFRAALPQSK